jgi:enamine deaminase RidA (YjgF/YER057c/UK114 family)
MITSLKINDFAQVSMFSTETGCEEFFIAVKTFPGMVFSKAIEELAGNYSMALKRAGLSDDTAAFSRLFVSDIINQKPILLRSSLFGHLTKGALSVIEQKPVDSGPLSLLSYHLRSRKNGFTRRRTDLSTDGWQSSLLLGGSNYSLLFTANFAANGPFDSYAQTENILKSLAATISQNGMQLLNNTIRTWIFVRDVDNHYKDMVRARKDFFAAHGLNDKTRYFASTGIQGEGVLPEQAVTVDSLSVGGLRPEQIVRMEAPAHLSPTIVYGVTFERGLRIRFGDRSHLYISGTASINNKGEVLFIGEAEQQARRIIENIRALLAPHRATLDDMAYIIAYVRNFHDREQVGKVLDEEIGKNIPLIFAEAPVCRPAWLVELEGVAIIPDNSGFPPFM